MTVQRTPEPDTRLAQLHAAYTDAKAAAEEANARLKSITDALKAELAGADNGAPEGTRQYDLVGPDGPPLRLTYVESWRIDTNKLKAQDPETYVRYAKKSGSWRLSTLKAEEAPA